MLLLFKFSFFLGGFSSLFLGIFLYIHNKNDIIAKTYSGLAICCAIWSLGFWGMISSQNHGASLYWRWLMEAGSVMIPALWFHFVYSFLGINESRKTEVLAVYIGSTLLWFLNLSDLFGSRIFATDMTSKNIFAYYPTAGIGYYLFFLFFFLVVLYSLFQLTKSLKKNLVSVRKSQIKYLIFSTVFAAGGGGMTFLLTLDFNVTPYGVILFAFYPMIVSYAVGKYQLFNIKVVVTQLLTFITWIFVLSRIFAAETIHEMILNAGLLIFLIITGILLIRSVSKEISQRERIESLAKNLKETNQKLARANERLTELDQMKSEFVSLATHQIRGPLSAIKGYASMILEGDFGVVGKEVKDAVLRVFQSSTSLAEIVEDFLNISRIELGRMKFDFAPLNVSAMVKSILSELKPNIESKNLNIEVAVQDSVIVIADGVKIKQVFANLIDNAVKYTKEGTIRVSLSCVHGKALFSVKDNGVGISPQTMPTLFQKFVRAKDASKTNLNGTGLGLYVAKEMVKAHHGRIWAESEGEGKGSTFFVELDCN